MSSAPNWQNSGTTCPKLATPLSTAMLTELAGPCSWRSVGLDLLEDGIWQAIHEGLGVEVEPSDMAEISRIRVEKEAMRRG